MRQRSRRVDGRFGEVQPGDGGTALRQDQRVPAEMALQVKYPLSGDRTQFGFDDATELTLSCAQVIKTIATWPGMQPDQLVPVRPVDRSPVLSRHFVSFLGPKIRRTPENTGRILRMRGVALNQRRPAAEGDIAVIARIAATKQACAGNCCGDTARR